MESIEKIKSTYSRIAEEAQQESNKIQQAIYHTGSLRLLLFVAGIAGIIYFREESWTILAGIALVTLLPFILLIKYHNNLFRRKDYQEKRAEVNRQELAALDYGYRPASMPGEGVCRPPPPVCLRSGRIRHTFIVPVRQPHLHRTGKTPVGKLAGTASRKERGYTGTTGSRTRTGSRTAIPPALPHPRHAAQRHSSRRNRTESMGGKSRRIPQE